MMTRSGWIVMAALALASAAGCQHRPEFIRDRSAAMAPPLVSADPPLVSADPALVADDPAMIGPRRATFVDRHPLLRKPAEYYESSGPSPVRKLAAATFIGVPAGVLGEMRQIVVGCPPGF